MTSPQPERDEKFEKQSAALQEFLLQYDPLDVAVALSVSDLYLPNIGSPVKHVYAFGIFAGMSPTAFGDRRLSTYLEFKTFLTALYALLPSFPMLEDFLPEPDWGVIRVRVGDELSPMFYGSVIERTPDFVEAFRITFGDDTNAIADMDFALSIQGQLLTSVPAQSMPSDEELSPGGLEVPSEGFWKICSQALISTDAASAHRRASSSNAFVVELGGFSAPKSNYDFGDACMSGTAWPFLGILVRSQFVPASIRSGPSIVLDQWAANSDASHSASAGAHARLAKFIADRYARVHTGPLRLRTEWGVLPSEVSAVMSAPSGIYVIAYCGFDTLDDTASFVTEFRRIVDRGERWGMVPVNGPAFELRNAEGRAPHPSQVKIIVVLAQGGTGFSSSLVPDAPARFMPLTDFITIFDSLEDLNELERFWAFSDDGRGMLSPISRAQADMFASFRDMSEVLVDGAVNPGLISLDPHWNSSWRYRELTKVWADAPLKFPDSSPSWLPIRHKSGVIELRSRRASAIVYSAQVGPCTVQAIVRLDPRSSSKNSVRMVDLYAQAIADRFQANSMILAHAPLFALPHLIFECVPDPEGHVDDDLMPIEKDPGAFRVDATLLPPTAGGATVLRLVVNATVIQHRLNDARDASFEIEALVRTVTACGAILGVGVADEIINEIEKSSSGPPRYYLQVVRREIDVPEYHDPVVPSQADYKLARRTLAVKFQELGVVPGRYELAEAKTKIDAGRNALRAYIEGRLATIDANELVRACIEENDALLARDRFKITRARQSLKHEVDYDRLEAIASAHKELGPISRHYRYLLEKVLSSSVQSGESLVSDELLRELIALVDWYMVLAGASDVLHNDVDVGGVDIDDNFVPQVFYSHDWSAREDVYARELAKTTLGIGLIQNDSVGGAPDELLDSEKIQAAFKGDAGFDLRNLLDALQILSQWVTHGFADELDHSYSATADEIERALLQLLSDLLQSEASAIVHFLTLEPSQVRHLPGSELPANDVPFWEHNKRLHRFAIRPLIPLGNQLCWGAEQVSRSKNVWMSAVLHGYLPADFQWPAVVKAVRTVKEGIEKELEHKTKEICQRFTPYVELGVDFFRRFRGEGFADVGDFDVLAYWPATNTLLVIECKYNQPPYVLKDSRRLRDQIFGRTLDDKRGQFLKIVGRREFVGRHRARMLELLKWPEPAPGLEATNRELYITRDIHWWMVHPPYPVPTEFIRVDGLDAWLTNVFGPSGA